MPRDRSVSVQLPEAAIAAFDTFADRTQISRSEAIKRLSAMGLVGLSFPNDYDAIRQVAHMLFSTTAQAVWNACVVVLYEREVELRDTGTLVPSPVVLRRLLAKVSAMDDDERWAYVESLDLEVQAADGGLAELKRPGRPRAMTAAGRYH